MAALRPRKILCATADPVERRALLAALAGPGREIECVRDGRQALVCYARDQACDLVLTAHALPGLGGLALVRRLRRAGFDGRVVVLCAAATATVVAAYRALGVESILIQPVAAGVVQAAILAV